MPFVRPWASDIAAQVAPHLPGWVHKPPAEDDGAWSYLEREDDARLTFYLPPAFHAPGPKRRLQVSGSFPKDGRGRIYGRSGQTPRISVAQDRPAEVIAKEIARRLLPIYLKNYAEAVEAKRADETSQATAEKLAERVAGILGATVGRQGGYADASVIYPETIEGTRCEVQVDDQGNARFVLSIHCPDTVALSVALAAWVQLNLQAGDHEDREDGAA